MWIVAHCLVFVLLLMYIPHNFRPACLPRAATPCVCRLTRAGKSDMMGRSVATRSLCAVGTPQGSQDFASACFKALKLSILRVSVELWGSTSSPMISWRRCAPRCARKRCSRFSSTAPSSRTLSRTRAASSVARSRRLPTMSSPPSYHCNKARASPQANTKQDKFSIAKGRRQR